MDSPYFLDSNIITYAFDQSAPEKNQRARELIAPENPWTISWQVIQEFSNVALHKFKEPLTPDYLGSIIELLLWPHCNVVPSSASWSEAFEVQAKTQYRFYDSLIVAAALESGAPTLFSEDLQDGRRVGDLVIRNPFHSL